MDLENKSKAELEKIETLKQLEVTRAKLKILGPELSSDTNLTSLRWNE